MAAVFELPVFYYSDRLLTKLGVRGTLVLAQLLYACRVGDFGDFGDFGSGGGAAAGGGACVCARARVCYLLVRAAEPSVPTTHSAPPPPAKGARVFVRAQGEPAAAGDSRLLALPRTRGEVPSSASPSLLGPPATARRVCIGWVGGPQSWLGYKQATST